VALNPSAIAALGSGLGTASILVLDESTSVPSVIDSAARFFEREACGQCPPCVLGTSNLRALIAGDRPGTNRLTPQAAIRETASFMSMHGYCGHARAGAASITGLFEQWQSEIIERLRTGETRSLRQGRDPFAPGSAERRALDEFLNRL
jgi:NADH-quinone oxidoreductase subunit F